MGILEYVVGLRPKSKRKNIVFLGLDNAGKTTLLRFLSGDVSGAPSVPTNGFFIKTIKIGGVIVQAFDVGGKHYERPYWRQFYKDVLGAVFVLDSADKERLAEAYEEIRVFLEEEGMQGIPIAIFANKRDSLNTVPLSEIENALNIKSDSTRLTSREETGRKPTEMYMELSFSCDGSWNELSTRPIKVFGCSAVSGEGVLDGLSWLLSKISDP